MPRNQLLDLVFSLFRETPRWTIKVLREKTQQPEAYLKEVLGEVASLHRTGEYNGMWELKDNFKEGVGLSHLLHQFAMLIGLADKGGDVCGPKWWLWGGY